MLRSMLASHGSALPGESSRLFGGAVESDRTIPKKELDDSDNSSHIDASYSKSIDGSREQDSAATDPAILEATGGVKGIACGRYIKGRPTGKGWLR